MGGITPYEILQKMFTHLSTTSSRTSAIINVGVKRILFTPQDIEQKISTFNEQSIQMKEYRKLSSMCRESVHHLKNALKPAYLHASGRLRANLSLNNVNCVKNAIFENYFERISHFSTV